MDADSDSDEEDEEYVPGADPDAPSDDDGTARADDVPSAALSIAKQNAVDAAFLDLFGYPFATAAQDARRSRGRVPTKDTRVAARHRAVLSTIFGVRAAAKLLAHAKFAAASAGPKPGGGGMVRLERRAIAEVKRFAGQEITVERVVLVPVMAGDVAAVGSAAPPEPEPAATASSAAVKARGVDHLLSELARPEKLSTLSKTTADWDLFKAKNPDAALPEQLESQARGNAAYLVKKDFLGRVDARQFEREKATRAQARARRGK